MNDQRDEENYVSDDEDHVLAEALYGPVAKPTTDSLKATDTNSTTSSATQPVDNNSTFPIITSMQYPTNL